jgi:hypothetical protein
VRESKYDVAERLVRLLSNGHAHEFTHGKSLCLFLLAAEEEGSDLSQVPGGAGVSVIMRLPRPDGAFIELNTLLGYAAEDHRAHAPVSHGECRRPFGGGLAIPQLERVCRCGAVQCERKADEQFTFHERYPLRACVPDINNKVQTS